MPFSSFLAFFSGLAAAAAGFAPAAGLASLGASFAGAASLAAGAGALSGFLDMLRFRLFLWFLWWTVTFYDVLRLDKFRLLSGLVGVGFSEGDAGAGGGVHAFNEDKFVADLQFTGYAAFDV